MANKPAAISAMGIPCIDLGTFVRLSCSRIPANNVNARAKPKAVETAKTTDSIRLKFFWITRIATPNMVQFVVIKGKNTPRAWYKEGETFLSIISTICTSAAITRINTIVCKYSR